jgi:hypothetical protein
LKKYATISVLKDIKEVLEKEKGAVIGAISCSAS